MATGQLCRVFPGPQAARRGACHAREVTAAESWHSIALPAYNPIKMQLTCNTVVNLIVPLVDTLLSLKRLRRQGGILCVPNLPREDIEEIEATTQQVVQGNWIHSLGGILDLIFAHMLIHLKQPTHVVIAF